MNRTEAVLYLIKNPHSKLNMFINCDGDKSNGIVELNCFGELVCNGISFGVFCANDKSEFEIIRELKEMSLADAIKLICYDEYTFMKSTVTGNYYDCRSTFINIECNELEGLWTVDGVYK